MLISKFNNEDIENAIQEIENRYGFIFDIKSAAGKASLRHFLARPKEFESPAFRLGVDPKPMYQMIASAKKSLEIQAFSLFSMPSRTAL